MDRAYDPATNSWSNGPAMVITSNLTTDGTKSIELKGTGATNTSFKVDPATLSFSGLVGTAGTPQAVTITISSIGLSTSGTLTLDKDTCASKTTLAKGESCQVKITFKAAASGADQGATLTVTTSATSPTKTVSISGTGSTAVASLTYTPSSLSWGGVATNISSTAQEVLVENKGTSAVTLNSVSVAAGASCKLSITFKAVSPGAVTGSVKIDSTPSASTSSIALKGETFSTSQGITCTASGTTAAQSLQVVIKPATIDQGKVGALFAVAYIAKSSSPLYGTFYYQDKSGNWTNFKVSDIQTIKAMKYPNLSSSEPLDVLKGMDLTALKDHFPILIYAGYGVGGLLGDDDKDGTAVKDLITGAKYNLVHTIQ